MDFLEKDLEEIIELSYLKDKECLIDRGLDFIGPKKMFRQKKIGNYGVADLIGVSKRYPVKFNHKNEICEDVNNAFLDITVFELKKDKIGISGFLQAIKYAKGIKRYLEEYRKFFEFQITIVLIGRDIDNTGSFCFLTDLICNNNDFSNVLSGQIAEIKYYTYKYDVDGLTFDSEFGYKLTDEGFN